jgi:hypothetical protein
LTRILIGCDPELFVRNPNSREYVSAHGMVPGDKHVPFPVMDGMIQVDGMALEFGIAPAATETEFVSRIRSVMGELRNHVDPGYEIVGHPTATFEPAYFKTVPSYAKELGCTPDFNAWTGKENPRPKGNVNFRTGAGHIHIGWTEDANVYDDEHLDTCRRVARQMDYYLGIYSLLWDGDAKRRELYGKAGAFRPKPYGVEYRTLSNAWVNSEMLMRWVYRAALLGTQNCLFNGKEAVNDYGDSARDIIDTGLTDWQKVYSIDLPVINPPRLQLAA